MQQICHHYECENDAVWTWWYKATGTPALLCTEHHNHNLDDYDRVLEDWGLDFEELIEKRVKL